MTPERKRLALLLSVLVVIAVLSFWPSSDGPAGAPARPGAAGGGRRPAAARTAGYTAETLPTRVVPAGTDPKSDKVMRNVFTFPTPTAPPTATPPPPTPTRVPAQGQSGFYGPMPTPPPPTATPIVPPPVPYKALGVFGPADHPIVALEDNGRLINAREGDVVDGRFIVVKINRESVDFAFVGLPKDITRRHPIQR